jgi:hypothetical protein
MLEVHSFMNLPKKLPIFIVKISKNIFLLPKWILKKRLIIWYLSAEPEKVLQYF